MREGRSSAGEDENAVQWISKALDDLPGLLGSDKDGLVIRSGAGLDGKHRVVLHELVQGTDAIDPKHDATKLRYGRPRQALIGVKHFKPVLYVEWFYLVRYAVTPLGDKIGPDDLVSVEGRALGLWSKCIGAYVMSEVMLRKSTKANAIVEMLGIDAQQEA